MVVVTWSRWADQPHQQQMRRPLPLPPWQVFTEDRPWQCGCRWMPTQRLIQYALGQPIGDHFTYLSLVVVVVAAGVVQAAVVVVLEVVVLEVRMTSTTRRRMKTTTMTRMSIVTVLVSDVPVTMLGLDPVLGFQQSPTMPHDQRSMQTARAKLTTLQLPFACAAPSFVYDLAIRGRDKVRVRVRVAAPAIPPAVPVT